MRGPEVLPGARESLRALEDARVPFVFVTNGGGELVRRRLLFILLLVFRLHHLADRQMEDKLTTFPHVYHAGRKYKHRFGTNM